MKWILIYIGSLIILIELSYSDETKLIYAKLGKDISLKCQHNIIITKSINAIAWDYNKTQVAIYPPKNQSTSESEKFKDRLKLNSSNGALTLKHAQYSDEGMFHCIMVIDSQPKPSNVTYHLKILDIPDEISMQCSSSDKTEKPCIDIEEKNHGQINAINCRVKSDTTANITWKKAPTCPNFIKETKCEGVDGKYTCQNSLANICNGTYQCKATFDKIEDVIFSKTFLLRSNNPPSLNKAVLIGAIGAVCGIAFIILCGIIFGIMKYRKRRTKSKEEELKAARKKENPRHAMKKENSKLSMNFSTMGSARGGDEFTSMLSSRE